jgi:hypothetical protein
MIFSFSFNPWAFHPHKHCAFQTIKAIGQQLALQILKSAVEVVHDILVANE